PICRCTRGDGFVDESPLVLAAAERRARAVLEDEIRAEAAAADRGDNRKPLYLGVGTNCTASSRTASPREKVPTAAEHPRRRRTGKPAQARTLERRPSAPTTRRAVMRRSAPFQILWGDRHGSVKVPLCQT